MSLHPDAVFIMPDKDGKRVKKLPNYAQGDTPKCLKVGVQLCKLYIISMGVIIFDMVSVFLL